MGEIHRLILLGTSWYLVLRGTRNGAKYCWIDVLALEWALDALYILLVHWKALTESLILNARSSNETARSLQYCQSKFGRLRLPWPCFWMDFRSQGARKKIYAC